MSEQPVPRPLPKHGTKLTQNKHTYRHLPRVGFETAIPVFERVKIVHVLDRAATVIGPIFITIPKDGQSPKSQ
jgi:hypothetical protein